jgi:threonine dehydratase
MVGGHALVAADNERVYRFEFPERPGALLKFLSGLGKRWNISMFHYRNHGAAYGRILVGLQVASGELSELENTLQQINYRYWDETDNRAYQLYSGKRA